jgi:TPR repeat protein
MIASLPEANQPLPSTMSAIDPAKVEAPPSTTVKVDPPASKADDRLTVRADELFRKGDVSGARLLLERSLASGNARAAFLLAETFDPNILSRLGAMGIRGDVAKAREFYAQAQALGIAQAGERMQALK